MTLGALFVIHLLTIPCNVLFSRVPHCFQLLRVKARSQKAFQTERLENNEVLLYLRRKWTHLFRSTLLQNVFDVKSIYIFEKIVIARICIFDEHVASLLCFFTRKSRICVRTWGHVHRILQILNLAKCRSSKRKFFVFFKGKHSFIPFKSTLEVIKKSLILRRARF